MRRALIPAFLLLLGSVVLGATVFRENLARAAGLAQAVSATIVSPLDTNGNVKVHEQGSLTIAAPTPVTGGSGGVGLLHSTTPYADPGTATALQIDMGPGINFVEFMNNGNGVGTFQGPADGGLSHIVLALTRPISWDAIYCSGSSDGCGVSWVGDSP